MEKLYCIINRHLEFFKVLEIDIKEEMNTIITFEYQLELAKGQIERKNLYKPIALKNGKVKAIFTDNQNDVGHYIKKMTDEERKRL